jgi:hypothetical protein
MSDNFLEMCKDCINNNNGNCHSHDTPIPIISPFFKEDDPCPCYAERYSIVAHDDDGNELLLKTRFHY